METKTIETKEMCYSVSTINTKGANKMKKIELIKYFYSKPNTDLSFICNVITNGCSNPYKKLAGLYNLSLENRVCSAQNDCYSVVIDGSIVSLSQLEKYSKKRGERISSRRN